MRYLILALLLLAGIFFITSTDAFKGFIGNMIPGLQTEAETARIQKEKAETKRRSADESGANPVLKAFTTLKNKADPIDRNRLVGGWLDENNCEYIVFREDGKSRIAMATNIKSASDRVIVTGAVTSIVYSEWDIIGSSLRFVDPRIKTLDISKLKIYFRGSKNTSAAPGAGSVSDELMSEMTAEGNRYYAENRVGGMIRKLEDNLLIIEYKDNTITYQRVSPFLTRDPDGANAPTWVVK